MDNKDIRVTIIMSETIKNMLDAMVIGYGSNMTSIINTMIIDKYLNEFKPNLGEYFDIIGKD